MKIMEYSREQARKKLDEWRNTKEVYSLNSEYSSIRENFIEFYTKAKDEASRDDRTEYMTDVLFGSAIYEYLSNQDWFNIRTAANDGFWRYLSVEVIPDIVADRWGVNNDNYYWKQSNRLWPKTAWWFIHLSLNNSLDDTKRVLSKNCFNSDSIQGIVERTGKKGTYVEVYREIIKQYSQLDYNSIMLFMIVKEMVNQVKYLEKE